MKIRHPIPEFQGYEGLLVSPQRCFVVSSGAERHPLAEGVEAIGLRELAQELNGTGLK